MSLSINLTHKVLSRYVVAKDEKSDTSNVQLPPEKREEQDKPGTKEAP